MLSSILLGHLLTLAGFEACMSDLHWAGEQEHYVYV
jgi:hypothetical protein